MTNLFVIYRGDAQTRFNRSYYIAQHVPMVERIWSPLGMQSISALFPNDSERGTICVCICGFPDRAALQATINDPQSRAIMDDVRRFTDSKPVQLVGEILP